MSRNMKRDYLKKLAQIETENGYKIDLGNYIYNPSLDNEYPGLKKKIDETPEKITFSQVYYFKYWDGSGEYIHKVYEAPNDQDSWHVITTVLEEVIEASNRFNLNKLVQLAANY